MRTVDPPPSSTVLIRGCGFNSPLLNHPRYCGASTVPWENTPRRSASTSSSETNRASSSGTPAWRKSRPPQSRSASGLTPDTVSDISLPFYGLSLNSRSPLCRGILRTMPNIPLRARSKVGHRLDHPPVFCRRSGHNHRCGGLHCVVHVDIRLLVVQNALHKV